MNHDFDIEEMLKRYRCGPDPRVKRSVLRRFNRALAGKQARMNRLRFWLRPVPLYIAAAALCIAVGASYFAGRRSERLHGKHDAAPTTLGDRAGNEAAELQWEIALGDIIEPSPARRR